jgi:hypothetical protein
MKIASPAPFAPGCDAGGCGRVCVGSASTMLERVFQPLLGGAMQDDLHSRLKTVLASSTIRRKANALSVLK